MKDVGLERNELTVRDGKGGKDRMTVLPAVLKEGLARQIAQVRALHARDLACGLGRVHLPHALARKYPNAAAEFGWQYVFPATRISMDPRDASAVATISTRRRCREQYVARRWRRVSTGR